MTDQAKINWNLLLAISLGAGAIVAFFVINKHQYFSEFAEASAHHEQAYVMHDGSEQSSDTLATETTHEVVSETPVAFQAEEKYRLIAGSFVDEQLAQDHASLLKEKFPSCSPSVVVANHLNPVRYRVVVASGATREAVENVRVDLERSAITAWVLEQE